MKANAVLLRNPNVMIVLCVFCWCKCRYADSSKHLFLCDRPNVCAEQELAVVGHRQPCVQAFTRVVKVWKQDCGGQLWCAGYERRTAYYTAYRQVYALTHQTAYKCCPGWAQRAGAAGCLHLCFNGGNCIEGSSQLCHCPSGFQGPRCQYDVNECAAGNGGCESQCCNTIGSFYCKCPDGLTLEEDGKACADVDECQVHNGGCQHRCVNTLGSYYCACKLGFRLHTDGRTCIRKNPCADRNGGCMHQCHNRRGTAHCECHPGYRLAADNKACEDVNECLTGLAMCAHQCLNTRGSFKCTCNPGYELGADGKQCYRIEMEIVNSCEANNGGCSHTCHHTSSGPACTCNFGYQLEEDQKTCTDINECDSGSHSCCLQDCYNYPGGYECACYAGYRLNTDGCGCDALDVPVEALDGRPWGLYCPNCQSSWSSLGKAFLASASLVAVCLEHTFGHDCSLSCEDCRNGGACNEDQTGCDCPEGWTGIICNQSE
uniref:Multiple epidermal growth factor-like domains protein 6 n=1 Tax=Apteryx owenii TaxID=8824 RepID=A0A8B9PKZ1_APTOW